MVDAWQFLRNLIKLKELDLDSSGFKDVNLLGGLVELETLDLRGIDGLQLVPLPGLSALKTIYVSDLFSRKLCHSIRPSPLNLVL